MAGCGRMNGPSGVWVKPKRTKKTAHATMPLFRKRKCLFWILNDIKIRIERLPFNVITLILNLLFDYRNIDEHRKHQNQHCDCVSSP
jgi:hypothetical protein